MKKMTNNCPAFHGNGEMGFIAIPVWISLNVRKSLSYCAKLIDCAVFIVSLRKGL